MNHAGRLFFSFFLFLILTFFNPESISASSIAISTGSAELKKDEEYTVKITLSINSADNTQYYLRGVFTKPGSVNYCGFTWNGNSWFSGPYSTDSKWKNFLPAIIKNNSWSGELKAKLDTNDNGCKNSGNYIFKVERFTNSGAGIFDPQNEQALQVTLPSPTPTPTLTPTPSQKFVPTRSDAVVKNNPTESSFELTSASPFYNAEEVAATDFITPIISEDFLATHESILGETITASNTPAVFPKKQKTKAISGKKIPVSLALGGMILLTSCGILSFQIFRSRKLKA